jgi:hypothetical protein
MFDFPSRDQEGLGILHTIGEYASGKGLLRRLTAPLIFFHSVTVPDRTE